MTATTEVVTVRESGTYGAFDYGGGVRIEAGQRLLVWGERPSRVIDDSIVTVSIPRHDPYLGEYVSAGMRRFTILRSHLRTIEAATGIVA